MKSVKELFDLRHRKGLRLGVLLLSTLMISTASALVFYSIQSRTTTTTSAAAVKFVAGGDTPAGFFINTAGTYARISTKSYPNATLTYDKVLNVTNTDTASHSIRLRSIAITSGQGSYSNSTSKIQFDLLNLTGAIQGTITYTGANGGSPWTTTGSPTTFVTIPASTQWTIRLITVADATAATGVVTTIDVAVDVQ